MIRSKQFASDEGLEGLEFPEYDRKMEGWKDYLEDYIEDYISTITNR